MERIAGDVELRHLGLPDLDALFVGARVERALDLQSGLGRRRRNHLDDGEAIDQRPVAPVLGDRTEQPVLDLVPLRGAGRIMVDVDQKPGLGGEVLQFALPQRS
jgi:hypothetical protein